MSLYQTYASWPDVLPPNALPTFLESGGTINVSGNLAIKSGVSSVGAIRGRHISYSKVTPLIGTMLLTSIQKLALDDFYSNVIGNGSLSFSGILDNDGVTKIYKFTSPPRYTPVGAGYQVDLELAILSAASSA